jgi:hypothetical protein
MSRAGVRLGAPHPEVSPLVAGWDWRKWRENIRRCPRFLARSPLKGGLASGEYEEPSSYTVVKDRKRKRKKLENKY